MFTFRPRKKPLYFLRLIGIIHSFLSYVAFHGNKLLFIWICFVTSTIISLGLVCIIAVTDTKLYHKMRIPLVAFVMFMFYSRNQLWVILQWRHISVMASQITCHSSVLRSTFLFFFCEGYPQEQNRSNQNKTHTVETFLDMSWISSKCSWPALATATMLNDLVNENRSISDDKIYHSIS